MKYRAIERQVEYTSPREPIFIQFLNSSPPYRDVLVKILENMDFREWVTKSLNHIDDIDDEMIQNTYESVVRTIATGGVPSLSDRNFFDILYKSFVVIDDVVQVEGAPNPQIVSQTAEILDYRLGILALIVYNLNNFYKLYDRDILKKCKVCGKFFCNKGRYAYYCSDKCRKKNDINQA